VRLFKTYILGGRTEQTVNKHLRLPVKIELKQHPGQEILCLSFRPQSINDWCLGLCLLQVGLIENLVVTEKVGKGCIKFHVRTTPETDRVARATLKSEVSQIELTKESLGYLQHFFLKYYRDGVAEVDHLDLEAINAETGKKELYITFRVPDSSPAVSPEEADARLRLRS
jgi:hypothetical protein